MTAIDIDPKYRLGVDAIDVEHAQLIKIVNELKEGLQREGKVNAAEIPHIVDSLIQYTKMHFGHEEALMSESQYPGLEAHRHKHVDLMQQVHKFAQELATKPEKVALQVNLFMTVWLFEHIIKDDGEFASYYKKRHAPR